MKDSGIIRENKRFDFLDLYRGFIMMFIVYNHTIDFKSTLYWSMFYSSSIPGFFFISALVFKDCSFRQFLLRMFNRMIVPFFLFEGLFFVIHLATDPDMSMYKLRCQMFAWIYHGKIFNYPMWYVRSLFAMSVLHYALLRLESVIGKVGQIIVGLALAGLAYFVWATHTDYRHACEYSDLAIAYFVMAIPSTVLLFPLFHYVGRCRDLFLRSYDWRLLTAVMVVSVVICYLVSPVHFLWFHHTAFVDCTFLQFYASIISAVLTMYCLAQLVGKMPYFNYVGRNTMVVLGFHLIIVMVMKRCLGIDDAVMQFAVLVVLSPAMIWFCTRWMPVFTGRFDFLCLAEGKIAMWWSKKGEKKLKS